MSSATFINLRINSAEQFKESVSEPTPNTKLYLTYGKVTSWANDSAPDTANSSSATEYEIWKNMIGGKKIFGSDISHAIKRFNWTANTVYYAYDHLSDNLYDGNNKFYVVTTDYNVYKCIANNNGANSTVEPSAVSAENLSTTSDGYIWKYMYTISDSDQMRFITNDYIPVKTLVGNDGSMQWLVQDAAIDGSINAIVVTDGGTGYSNVSNMSVSILGDGSGATATASINVTTGKVTSVTMNDYGVNYTYATVSISGGGGNSAIARVIISPSGGHGYNPLYELGGSNLILNPSLSGTLDTNFPTTNDFRQIAILKDPIVTGTSNVMSNATFLQTYVLTLSGSGDFVEDEIVYQGGTVDTSSFSGRVVSWDKTNSKIFIINTVGIPAAGAIVGANSLSSRFVSSITEKQTKDHGGQILYVNNLTPVSRSSDQTEDFKIVVKF